MTDQVSAQTSTDGVAPVADVSNAETQAAPDVASLEKRLKIAEAKAAEAVKEVIKYRKRNDDETQQRLKEQGDFKALYEQSLPQLEKAKRWDSYTERQQAKLEAMMDSLPSFIRRSVEVAPDIDSKWEIVDLYREEQAKASPTSVKQPSQPPPSGIPAGAPPANIDLYSLTDREFDELKRTNPDRFNQEISRLRVKSPPVPSTASWLTRQK